jgi:hypothetical protein
MRHDLRDWEQALALAKSLNPQEVSIISKEYANSLEMEGSEIIYLLILFSNVFIRALFRCSDVI